MYNTRVFFLVILLSFSNYSLSSFVKLLSRKSLHLIKNDNGLGFQQGGWNQGQCGVNEFSKNIPNNGRYITESYIVTTSDGYVLQMFRVTLVKSELAKLPANLQTNINRPVLIQHGLFSDSTDMVEHEKTSFSFYMINKGFDCWFGNNRGSKFSLTDKNLSISENNFYNYSFTEMGLYDIPTFYQTILKEYNNDKNKQIIYFGHSEGTSQLFVALTDSSTKDYIRKHTERFFALSPVAYMKYIHNLALSWLSKMQAVIDFAAHD